MYNGIEYLIYYRVHLGPTYVTELLHLGHYVLGYYLYRMIDSY